MADKMRRIKMVQKGGRHILTVRVVAWIDKNGKGWTSVQVDGPDGYEFVDNDEVLRSLEIATELCEKGLL